MLPCLIWIGASLLSQMFALHPVDLVFDRQHKKFTKFTALLSSHKAPLNKTNIKPKTSLTLPNQTLRGTSFSISIYPLTVLLKRSTSGAASTKHRLSNEACLHCSTAPLLLKAETLQPNCHSPTPFQLIAKGWALCPKCSHRRQRCSVQIVLHSTCCFLAGCFQNCNPRNRLLQENAQKIFRHVSCLEEVSIQSLPKCKDPK